MVDYEPLRVKRYLENIGLKVVGDVVLDVDSPSHLFATIQVARTTENKQEPSKQVLNEVRTYFLSQAITLDFILLDPRNSDLETGLRATLMLVFSGLRNVFCAVEEGRASVWIDLKKSSDEPLLREIEKHSKKYFQLSGIELNSIQSITDLRTPTKTAILDNIRILAPATRGLLQQRLSEKGFVIPSDDWLRRQLDSLRRSGALVGVPDDKIGLSFGTLRALGTRKNARSPDITRLLAVARKQG